MTMQSELRACLLPLVTEDVYFSVLPVDTVPTSSRKPGGLLWDNEGRWDNRARWDGDIARHEWSAIVISADIATPANTTCGASDTDDHRMQIDLYGASQGNILSLRKQVFTAIENKFPMAYRLNDFGDYDTDLKVYRRIIEYSIPAE